MLNEIIDLVKEQVEGVVAKANVPSDKQSAAVEATTTSIVDGLKNNLSLDNISSITSLFGGDGDASGLANNSVVTSIQSSVVSALKDKVGLSPAIASSISTTVIPAILGLLSKKSNDPGDSFDFSSLLGAFSGGSTSKGGILNSIMKLFGK